LGQAHGAGQDPPGVWVQSFIENRFEDERRRAFGIEGVASGGLQIAHLGAPSADVRRQAPAEPHQAMGLSLASSPSVARAKPARLQKRLNPPVQRAKPFRSKVCRRHPSLLLKTT